MSTRWGSAGWRKISDSIFHGYVGREFIGVVFEKSTNQGKRWIAVHGARRQEFVHRHEAMAFLESV